MHPSRTAAILLLTGAIALLTACGGGPSGPGTSPGTTPATSTPAPSTPSGTTAPSTPTGTPLPGQTAALAISVRATPDTAAKEFVLNCQGPTSLPGSTAADPDAACAAVDANGGAAFAPPSGPPPVCTQQYGGPATATITGTFGGKAVTADFSQTDGCKISAWNSLAPVFGSPAGSS
ncbi:SSI family serine proteinase inhibitor [Pseudarthrobacter sp. P1]|uniref:SSI family serine proteinase inhibitor n=1 Tax=Pseudarthrobacter sp. P1 TaxID=3418418 RepID=UPI003CEBE0A8